MPDATFRSFAFL